MAAREEFVSMKLRNTSISNRELDPWISLHDMNGIIFAQGDRDFLEFVYHKLVSSDGMKLISICTDEDFWMADSFWLSHAQCGGITDGEWSVYSQNLWFDKPKELSVRRTLKHILSSVESAGSAAALKLASHVPYDRDERIRWTKRYVPVTTTSVFEKGNKVD